MGKKKRNCYLDPTSNALSYAFEWFRDFAALAKIFASFIFFPLTRSFVMAVLTARKQKILKSFVHLKNAILVLTFCKMEESGGGNNVSRGGS